MKEIIVEVPHRISGFFEIVDVHENGTKITDPIKLGSRGAGFNLNAVGRTRIEVEELSREEETTCEIYINNNLINENAETTFFIFNHLKERMLFPVNIKIFHEFDLPVGCGYGASGSGALGSVHGLNELLKLNLTHFECGQIAHVAEVVNKTGLGTVCGMIARGLSILKEPGYPCVFETIKVPNNINVICGTFGKIATKSILSDPQLSKRIKKAGQLALKKLLQSPTIKTFIECSIEFVKNTHILEHLNLSETKALMEELNELDIMGASMNQLGRSVYAICHEDDKNSVINTFKSYLNPDEIHVLKIYEEGIKIINIDINYN
ncbi:MAG: pantoate kinase [Promethearchaeota archaeon]